MNAKKKKGAPRGEIKMLPPQGFARKLRKNPTRAERLLGETISRVAPSITVLPQHAVVARDRGFILDFWIPEFKLAVEADGKDHARRLSRDQERTQLLLEFTDVRSVLRIRDEIILDNPLNACWRIFREIERLEPGTNLEKLIS